jgi:hypothetical protein
MANQAVLFGRTFDGGSFGGSDERMMVAFNAFCRISLDNARLY